MLQSTVKGKSMKSEPEIADQLASQLEGKGSWMYVSIWLTLSLPCPETDFSQGS